MNDELDLRGEPDEVTPLNSSAEDAIDYNVIFQGRDKRENFVKKSTVIGEVITRQYLASQFLEDATI